jgi:hypothetical protein
MASSMKDTISSITKQKNSNCIIIRGKETNEQCLKNIQSILPHFEPIILKNYGNEYTEKEELISNYHMPNDLCEIGKFYDHEGSSLWYYYVYGKLTRSKEVTELKENFIASRLLNRSIYGDIAIVRSGPTTSKIDPWLSTDKLAQTVIFYETHDPKTIFGERERKRFFEKLGMEDQTSMFSCVIGFDYN